jgi:uncharacterized RDD family membrane protein YckC
VDAPSGKPANRASDTDGGDPSPVDHPGQRFDLLASGPRSVAPLGRRLLALIVDCVLAALVTSLFVRPDLTHPDHVQSANYWSLLVWFVMTVLGTTLFAATPGMIMFGLRVGRITGTILPPWRAAVRAVLVALIVPAVIWDVDRRGLHDKAAGTIVLTIR